MSLFYPMGGSKPKVKATYDDQTPHIYRLYNTAEYVLPTEDDEGNTLPGIIALTNNAFGALACSCRKLTIPEYFTSVTINNISSVSYYPVSESLEELIIMAPTFNPAGGTSGWQNWMNMPMLKRLVMPELTSVSFAINKDVDSLENISDTLVFDFRKATSVIIQLGTTSGSHIWDVTGSRFDEAVSFMTTDSSSDVTTKHMNGTIVCPKAENIGHWITPVSGTLELRCPAMTTMYGSRAAYSGGSGVLEWYIGPNLGGNWHTNVINQCKNNSTYIKIHIPPGESDTKDYLDTQSIPYDQNYTNWQSDLGQ